MPRSRNNVSLVRASLEIGRVLADHHRLVFHAKGTCMYPAIRPGDVLRIQSRAAADVALGDIAVCRRPRYMFSHRVIGKGLEGGRPYILTRPDRSIEGGDGPTFDEDLLGVVVAIERKGKPVPLHPAAYPWIVRGYLCLKRTLMAAVPSALARLDGVLARVQDNGFYRRIARRCLAMMRMQISCTVRVPMPALGGAAYRQLSSEEFDARKDWRGRPVERWTLVLHFDGTSEPAAWTRFERSPGNEWCVEESFVRWRYRGAGLDEALLREAGAILLRDHRESQRHVEVQGKMKSS